MSSRVPGYYFYYYYYYFYYYYYYFYYCYYYYFFACFRFKTGILVAKMENRRKQQIFSQGPWY